MCKNLFLKGYVQVVMKSNVKVCTLLLLEVFIKITMKCKLWWCIRKWKWFFLKKMNFDKKWGLGNQLKVRKLIKRLKN